MLVADAARTVWRDGELFDAIVTDREGEEREGEGKGGGGRVVSSLGVAVRRKGERWEDC